MSNNTAVAVFAGGCFWCTEAVFQRVKGVISVTPGYAGEPEAECLKIEFDSQSITYETLLEVFFTVHDATTLNKQGNDEGPQYRSAIFYTSPEQKTAAEKAKGKIAKAVTEIVPLTTFFPAASYHHNYYQNHPTTTYCQVVIDPKIAKLIANFPDLIKR